mmetsp:Transcript_12613/g.41924  ORF Transcript_12613/g.41924 Transcript_12613/m.41924 type:complete len:218 (+) Transcript_12613:584-1237(+)
MYPPSSDIFDGTYKTTTDAPSATTVRSIHVFVTQSSGLEPAVHLEMYTGNIMDTGVIAALSVAMCCFGTPRSNSFSVVRVSAALNAMARVSKTALSVSTEGNRAMDKACLYAPTTVKLFKPSVCLNRSLAVTIAPVPASRFSATKNAEQRNTTPQNVMNPPRPTDPYAFSNRNPVNETKNPAVCPTLLHVDARPTFFLESIVKAHPSTAMSWLASNT